MQDTNTDLRNQINNYKLELAGLKSEYTNRASRWNEEHRRLGEMIIDRYYVLYKQKDKDSKKSKQGREIFKWAPSLDVKHIF